MDTLVALHIKKELMFEDFHVDCVQVCSLAGQFYPFHGSLTDSVATLQYHMARRRRVIEL